VDVMRLQQRILVKLSQGWLPTTMPHRTWVTAGEGDNCDGCDQVISAKGSSYGCELPDGSTLRFHALC
jgi:hypothetical protein